MCNAAVDFDDDIYTGGEWIVEQLKEWIFTIIVAALCLAVLDAFVPKGAIRSIAKMTGGLVMFLAVLRPLTGGALPDEFEAFESCRENVDEQIEHYRQGYLQEMETIIAQKTGAYISEKAEQLGIVCEIQVKTEVKDEVPVPSSVTLHAPREERLARWIEQEIGIGEEAQYWEGTQ